MSAATESTSASSSRASSFLRSRLGSFLAIAPLGVWTVVHLWNNLAAFEGPEAWQRSVTEYPHPIAQLITGIIVLLPLALHTAWGIGRLLTTKPNNVRYGFWGNFKYLLQRVTAIGVLLFLGAHLWLAYLSPRLRTPSRPEQFADIAHEMHHHGPTLMVYLLGTLGVSYHLANGLHTFAMGWGLAASRRALKRLEIVSIVFLLALWGMSWAAIYALWVAGT